MRYIPLLILIMLVACATSTIQCWDGSTVAKGVSCPEQKNPGASPELEKLLTRHELSISYQYNERPILTMEQTPFAGSVTKQVFVRGDKIKIINFDEFGAQLETIYLDTSQQSIHCETCTQPTNFDDYVPILPTDWISSIPTNAILDGTPYPYTGSILVRDQDEDIFEGSSADIARPTQVIQWDEGSIHYWLELDTFSGLPRRVLSFQDGVFFRGVEYARFGYDTVDEDVVTK